MKYRISCIRDWSVRKAVQSLCRPTLQFQESAACRCGVLRGLFFLPREFDMTFYVRERRCCAYCPSRPRRRAMRARRIRIEYVWLEKLMRSATVATDFPKPTISEPCLQYALDQFLRKWASFLCNRERNCFVNDRYALHSKSCRPVVLRRILKTTWFQVLLARNKRPGM